MRRRLVALSAVPLMLLATAACGGSDEGETDSGSSGSIAGVEVSGDFGAEPKVTVDKPLKLEETQTEVLTEGDGNEVVEGNQALLHLYVANGSNGKKALATYDQGVPASFQMSEDQMFRSVLDATVGQKVGSRVVVAATPEDAFGAQGAPQFQITAKDAVIFVIDVMSVQPADTMSAPEGDQASGLPGDLPTIVEKGGDVTGVGFAKAAKPPKELQVHTLIEGTGPEVRDDSLVTFDYLGQVYGSDKVFDESYSTEPRTFAVGIGGLIKAWDEAIVGAKQGSRLMVIAPPDMAYGEQGSPPDIPKNATLVFVVDVLGVDAAA